MSERRVTFHVTIKCTAFGELRTGIWCPTCLLPSAVEQDFLVDGDLHSAGTARICPPCGLRRWTTWTDADVDLRAHDSGG